MLDQLPAQKPDALLALIKLYAADNRAEKIDLGVGVYRDESGATPVFSAIKAAESRLLEGQDSKSYLGPEGDMGFVRAMAPWALGGLAKSGRIDGVQTPGGTGAVRLAADLMKRAGVKTVWMGTPSWPNHEPIFAAAGLAVKTFCHLDVVTQDLDFTGIQQALAAAEAGDAVLLHGCCHNPTGADYDADQWSEITQALLSRQLFPLIDMAYQGLGHGFEEDRAGLLKVLGAVPEALIAYSCDKSFGMYRERVGALYVMTAGEGTLPAVMSNVYALARSTWSMPPDHGAAAVRIVLEDSDLTQMWLDEVTQMRARMRRVRDSVSQYQRAGTVNLAPVALQNGLFSMLSVSPEQVAALRERFGIYMAGSGRINIAGLNHDNIPHFIEGLRSVTAG